MTRLTTEEKRNRDRVNDLIHNATTETLNCKVIPSGCHIEIQCNDVYTLEVIEIMMQDYLVEQQLDSIRGSIRITYNHYVKN